MSRETTIVTTLQVTHVLRGETADSMPAGLPVFIAEASRKVVAAGYPGLVQGRVQPDDVCVSSVQVFSRDDDAQREAEA